MKPWSLDVNYIVNSRSVIKPYEIDIFIPEFNLGIEFNGVFWHSEIIKDKKYHIDKKKLGESLNIDLIYIWEDDWINKNEIVKSILKSRLKKSDTSIGSRKMEMKELKDEKIIKEFLNENHIQGWCVSDIKIGLFYNNDLVTISTFSKGRKNINQKCWELVRFCNKKNFTSIGGLNRLFKYFIEKYSPIEVVSYSDNDLFSGNSYTNIGMSRVDKYIPNYWWCDGRVRHNRWKFRKDSLIKLGFDSSKSGTQIMTDRGYFRCWGSGNSKWIWKNSPIIG